MLSSPLMLRHDSIHNGHDTGPRQSCSGKGLRPWLTSGPRTQPGTPYTPMAKLHPSVIHARVCGVRPRSGLRSTGCAATGALRYRPAGRVARAAPGSAGHRSFGPLARSRRSTSARRSEVILLLRRPSAPGTRCCRASAGEHQPDSARAETGEITRTTPAQPTRQDNAWLRLAPHLAQRWKPQSLYRLVCHGLPVQPSATAATAHTAVSTAAQSLTRPVTRSRLARLSRAMRATPRMSDGAPGIPMTAPGSGPTPTPRPGS